MANSEVEPFEDEFPLVRSCPELNELRTASELTDLHIQLKEEKVLHVHRVVVAARIPSLRRTMTNKTLTVKWPTVSIESASTLINYLYTGQIEITCTNAMNMILLAKQLTLPRVEDWAVSFLSARLQNDNLSECWEFAAAVNCTGLREACVKHMKTFFEAFVASHLFLELPADVVLSILRADDMQVDSEEKVFEAIKRWVHPTGTLDEDRIIHAPAMLKEVRWSQTKNSFRKRLIESDDLIVSRSDCMQCIGLADNWIGYSSLRKQGQCPFNDRRRPASISTRVLVFGKSVVDNLTAVYQYDFEANTCEELSAVEGLEGARFLAHDESVFVIGGRINGQDRTSGRVDEYRTRERRWRKLPGLQNPREDHAAAVVTVGEPEEQDSLLFVCGGRYRLNDTVGGEGLSSCELFDLRNNRWHKLPEMRKARDATACVALTDGRVFVFGGWRKKPLASVEFCHLKADWSRTIETASKEEFWRPLEPMRTPRYAHVAVAFKGKIIVAGGYVVDEADEHIQSIVEVFSPPDAERPLGEWTRIADLLVARCPHALLVYKDRLYVLGNDADPRNTIEKFIPDDAAAVTADLSSWHWTALDSLDNLNEIHGAVVI